MLVTASRLLSYRAFFVVVQVGAPYIRKFLTERSKATPELGVGCDRPLHFAYSTHTGTLFVKVHIYSSIDLTKQLGFLKHGINH